MKLPVFKIFNVNEVYQFDLFMFHGKYEEVTADNFLKRSKPSVKNN